LFETSYYQVINTDNGCHPRGPRVRGRGLRSPGEGGYGIVYGEFEATVSCTRVCFDSANRTQAASVTVSVTGPG